MDLSQWESLSAQLSDSLIGKNLSEFSIPLAFLLWSLIFGVSLKKIDASHLVAALTYITFCAATGVLILSTFPPEYLKRSSLQIDFIFVCLFAMIAAANWYRGLSRHPRMVYSKKRENK